MLVEPSLGFCLEAKMNDEWEQLIKELPKMFEEFLSCPLRSRNELSNAPKKGVYTFYEDGEALYVGRSDRLIARVQEHGRPSSGHNTAPFAFNLTKEAMRNQGIDTANIPRSKLEQEPVFKKAFVEAKERVARMKIRFVEIDDPIKQTLFEVYAAMKLQAPYNDFRTH